MNMIEPVSFDEFIDPVLAIIPEASERSIKAAALRTMIDFATLTSVWTFTSQIELIKGQREYELAIPMQSRIDSFSRVYFQPKGSEDMRALYSTTPYLSVVAQLSKTRCSHFWRNDQKIGVNAAEEGILHVVTVLTPNYVATVFDGAVFMPYLDGIVAGIAEKYLMMPAKEWTDTTQGMRFATAYGTQYAKAIAKANLAKSSSKERPQRTIQYGGY